VKLGEDQLVPLTNFTAHFTANSMPLCSVYEQIIM